MILHINYHLHKLIFELLNQITSDIIKKSSIDQAFHISYCNLTYILALQERIMLSILVTHTL